jgi:hypothetical protein
MFVGDAVIKVSCGQGCVDKREMFVGDDVIKVSCGQGCVDKREMFVGDDVIKGKLWTRLCEQTEIQDA